MRDVMCVGQIGKFNRHGALLRRSWSGQSGRSDPRIPIERLCFAGQAMSVSGWIAAVALVSFLVFVLVGLAGVAQIWAELADASQEKYAHSWFDVSARLQPS